MSLDAPIVGVVWLLQLSKTYDLPTHGSVYWCLFCAIWIVYSNDRLFESDSSLVQQRHTFHQRYKRRFSAIAILASFGSVFLFLSVQELQSLLIWGVFPGTGVAIYLVISLGWSQPSILKEWIKNLTTSIVFSYGCLLPLFANQGLSTHIADFTGLSFVVLLNLRLIDSFEKKHSPNLQSVFEIIAFVLPILALVIWSDSPVLSTWFISSILMSVLYFLPRDIIHRSYFDLVLLIPPLVSFAI